jgi:hypothetical protein
MKIIYWNIRGVGNRDSRIALSELYRIHGPSLVFLAEPMVSLSYVPRWFWSLDFSRDRIGSPNYNFP